MQFTAIIIAARRGGARTQFFQNWENDIFNPKYWIEDIVFAYNFVPISVAVNRNYRDKSFSLTGKIGAPPRPAAKIEAQNVA